jgi:hypothetical protein
MKAFLQHDQNGLFYRDGGEWVGSPQQALSFSTTADAEHFRRTQHIGAVHAVARLDPSLISRLTCRAPGAYQVGE